MANHLQIKGEIERQEGDDAHIAIHRRGWRCRQLRTVPSATVGTSNLEFGRDVDR